MLAILSRLGTPKSIRGNEQSTVQKPQVPVASQNIVYTNPHQRHLPVGEGL